MPKITVHLGDELLTALKAEVNRAGVPLAEVVRQAIEAHLNRGVPATRLGALRSARGLWKGRRDLPDTSALRRDLE